MAPKKTSVVKQATRKKSIVSEIEAIPVMAPVIQEPVVTPEISREPINVIYKRPAQLLILALVLGWVSDYLFWKHTVGINFAIFMTLCLLGGFYWLLSNGIKPDRKSLWLLVPFLFFVVVPFCDRSL